MSKSRNPDHVRRTNVPGPSNEVITERLTMLVKPVIESLAEECRQLGVRDRILNFPRLVAMVLTILWRQVPSRRELTRLVRREDLLWSEAEDVSQVAVNNRFLTFPAILFERLTNALLPTLNARWLSRTNRPLPVSIAAARPYFDHIWMIDGSTLEALFRHLDSLKKVSVGQLAGKMFAVLDMVTQLPVTLWFDENPMTHDTQFLDQLLALLRPKTLLVFDLGFYDFTFFNNLRLKGSHFITRLKSNASFKTIETLNWTATIHDRLISLGSGQHKTPILTLRLVEVKFGGLWYHYLTSVLDPHLLPAVVVADLYRRRWNIESAFKIIKRLLNLGYLWTGSVNGVLLQVWGTWLFYAILVDLGDAVADALGLKWECISLEMVYRGLYHFHQAYLKGLAHDLIAFLIAPENKDLGIVKANPNALGPPLPI